MPKGWACSYLNSHLTALKGKKSLWQDGLSSCHSEQAAHLQIAANSTVTVGLKHTHHWAKAGSCSSSDLSSFCCCKGEVAANIDNISLHVPFPLCLTVPCVPPMEHWHLPAGGEHNCKFCLHARILLLAQLVQIRNHVFLSIRFTDKVRLKWHSYADKAMYKK